MLTNDTSIDYPLCLLAIDKGYTFKSNTYFEASKLQKWLRDAHKLFIQISLVEDTEGISESFECIIVDLKKQNYAFESTSYLETYEDALNLGLNEALKLI